MASAQQVCPVVGTTTSVLPPNHPHYDHNDPEARCPVTNAKVSHHGDSIIHEHPSDSSAPQDVHQADASACPALKNANRKESITDATCPIVGPVSAYLPPTHPHLTEKESGAVCPVTNATLDHHKSKVHEHPSVPEDAPVAKCPVANNLMNA
ncbi:hypothetical protein WHR41_03484 [Cladosporium halotolerans]|uniref:Uncharacterized protein n=1 Tax=Cladosporium halotolerans TaxID=1052096 RepID=A0AB34KUX1_9PEZI